VTVEQVTESAVRMSEVLREAEVNIKTSQKKVKQKLCPSTNKYKVGDKVWRQNVRSQQRKGGKLEANYQGPFIITALDGKSADLEDGRGVKVPKINTDHLRPHSEETPKVPHKLQKPSKNMKIHFASPLSSPALSPPHGHMAILHLHTARKLCLLMAILHLQSASQHRLLLMAILHIHPARKLCLLHLHSAPQHCLLHMAILHLHPARKLCLLMAILHLHSALQIRLLSRHQAQWKHVCI